MRRQVSRLLLAGGAALLFACLWPTRATAADGVCYQDDQGRIVQRRRPGFRQIPCPPSEPAQAGEPDRAADTAPSAPVSNASTRRRIRQEHWARRAPVTAERKPNPASVVPRPGLPDYVDRVPVPDRWRLVNALGYPDNWWDPYNQNTLKGDRPIHDDWFFNLNVISDSVVEIREIPTPVGGSSTGSPGQVDVFGSADQVAAVHEETHGGNIAESSGQWLVVGRD